MHNKHMIAHASTATTSTRQSRGQHCQVRQGIASYPTSPRGTLHHTSAVGQCTESPHLPMQLSGPGPNSALVRRQGLQCVATLQQVSHATHASSCLPTPHPHDHRHAPPPPCCAARYIGLSTHSSLEVFPHSHHTQQQCTGCKPCQPRSGLTRPIPASEWCQNCILNNAPVQPLPAQQGSHTSGSTQLPSSTVTDACYANHHSTQPFTLPLMC